MEPGLRPRVWVTRSTDPYELGDIFQIRAEIQIGEGTVACVSNKISIGDLKFLSQTRDVIDGVSRDMAHDLANYLTRGLREAIGKAVVDEVYAGRAHLIPLDRLGLKESEVKVAL